MQELRGRVLKEKPILYNKKQYFKPYTFYPRQLSKGIIFIPPQLSRPKRGNARTLAICVVAASGFSFFLCRHKRHIICIHSIYIYIYVHVCIYIEGITNMCIAHMFDMQISRDPKRRIWIFRWDPLRTRSNTVRLCRHELPQSTRRSAV